MTADDRVKKLFTSKGSNDDGTMATVDKGQWHESEKSIMIEPIVPRPEPAKRRYHLDIQINGDNLSGHGHHQQVIMAEVHQSSSDDCLSEISDPVPDYDEDQATVDGTIDETATVDTGIGSGNKGSKSLDTDQNSCVTEDTTDQLLSTVSTDEGIYHDDETNGSNGYNQQSTMVKVYIKASNEQQQSETINNGRNEMKQSDSNGSNGGNNGGSKIMMVNQSSKSMMTSAILSAASTPSGAIKITITPREESSDSTIANGGAMVPPPPPPPPPPMPPGSLLLSDSGSNIPDSLKSGSEELDLSLKSKLAKKSKLKNGHGVAMSFIPPTFTTPPPDSDMNIKPSEYLKKVISLEPRAIKDIGAVGGITTQVAGAVKSSVTRFMSNGNNVVDKKFQSSFMKRSVSETHLNYNHGAISELTIKDEATIKNESVDHGHDLPSSTMAVKSNVQAVKSFLFATETESKLPSLTQFTKSGPQKIVQVDQPRSEQLKEQFKEEKIEVVPKNESSENVLKQKVALKPVPGMKKLD